LDGRAAILVVVAGQEDGVTASIGGSARPEPASTSALRLESGGHLRQARHPAGARPDPS
jgi:hypothetical protein